MKSILNAFDSEEIIRINLFLSVSSLNDICDSTLFISSTGSAAKDTRIVSPIPSKSNVPNPIEDFMLPETKLPASVIPRCNG